MENNANKAYPRLSLKVTGTIVLNAGEKGVLFNSYLIPIFLFSFWSRRMSFSVKKKAK